MDEAEGAGKGSILKGPVDQHEDVHLYSKNSRNPLKGLKQGNDIVRFVFWEKKKSFIVKNSGFGRSE